MGTKTETETIEHALDQVISEDERNRRAWSATERFLLVPNLTDWRLTGSVLIQFGARFGSEMAGKSRPTNDALIAMSAARLGLTVQTTDAGDFGRLAEIREFQCEEIAI